MNGNRSGVLLFALVLVGGVLTVSWSGIPVAGQSPGAAQPPAAQAPAVHSVKISLAPSKPGEKDCQVITLTPETVGVYPKDRLIFNIENGCSTEATVSIEQVTLISPPGSTVRLFDDELKLPKDVSVPEGGRPPFEMTIGAAGLEDEHRFDYVVTVTSQPSGGGTGKPRKLPGTIVCCRRPPCPTG